MNGVYIERDAAQDSYGEGPWLAQWDDATETAVG